VNSCGIGGGVPYGSTGKKECFRKIEKLKGLEHTPVFVLRPKEPKYQARRSASILSLKKRKSTRAVSLNTGRAAALCAPAKPLSSFPYTSSLFGPEKPVPRPVPARQELRSAVNCSKAREAGDRKIFLPFLAKKYRPHLLSN
jgi:hypothetical protein